tara:strand:+ start:73 stop:5460 length:5388 start_codon:yes stop_codon:yes gene_type:complete
MESGGGGGTVPPAGGNVEDPTGPDTKPIGSFPLCCLWLCEECTWIWGGSQWNPPPGTVGTAGIYANVAPNKSYNTNNIPENINTNDVLIEGTDIIARALTPPSNIDFNESIPEPNESIPEPNDNHIGTEPLEDRPGYSSNQKPTPKYTKTSYSTIAPNEMENEDNHKRVPINWQNYVDLNSISGREVRQGTPPPSPPSPSAPPPPLPPAPTPGPCCMNDTYVHETTTATIGGWGWSPAYLWDAISETFWYPWHEDHTVPGAVGDPTTFLHNYYDRLYNTQPATSRESGGLDRTVPVGPGPPPYPGFYTDVGITGYMPNNANPFIKFKGDTVAWNGTTARLSGNFSTSAWWAFPPRLDADNALWGANAGSGTQTMWDWSNSINVIPDLESTYASLMQIPGTQREKWNEIPEFIFQILFWHLPLYVPFCNGRAGLNPGLPHYDNPWIGKSYINPTYNITGEVTNPAPRRLGWEGWIKRPTNVDWNWGNRGAYKTDLHYTLGPAELSGGTVLDSLTCSDGHCQYPNWPGIIIMTNYPTPGTNWWPNPDQGQTNVYPHQIKYDQLYHQEVCCSNSHWFQNNRVLRNYSETTWNVIGSPWNGGKTTLTFQPDTPAQWTLDLATVIHPSQWWGLIGSNGNGPPTIPQADPSRPPIYESADVKYSCSTIYTLNRLLQYISNSQDFEEIFAESYGNNFPDGSPANQMPKRMWFPVQAGYYARGDSISSNYDEPWEMQYRLRDVHEFYAMVNFCDDVSRDGIEGGKYHTLGNPPIGGGIDTVTGVPTSKLHPGTWPWGHCITYACGNPEYSQYFDDGTTAWGGEKITYNTEGERGCEAQAQWASLPVNNYYSNITFEGINVAFFDEARGGAYTSIRVPKWSFSNSPDWNGQVPTTFEEAKESAIGLMMWLGHNSWDDNYITSSNTDGTIGRPAGRSGGTAIQYWNPVNTNWNGTPNVGLDESNTSYPWSNVDGFTHYVADLNNPRMLASTNGYYRGIRPNYTYLDVVEHIERMKEQFPIKFQNSNWDYNNRPEGEPEYVNGVAVGGTYKTNNPPTGIAHEWWVDSGPPVTGEPDGWPPYEYGPGTTVYLGGWARCNYFPGESVGRFITNSPYVPLNYPPANDPSWQGTKDGPGDPGGGNYCTQHRMVGMNKTYGPSPFNINGAYATGGAHYIPGSSPPGWDWCSNWPLKFTNNEYINNCFEPGMQGTNNVTFQTPWYSNVINWLFKPGDIRGRFKSEVMGCNCFQWYTHVPRLIQGLRLVPGPHCQGCDIGCCTNEKNDIWGTKCEYVYPQGLFRSKHDCEAAYHLEPDPIPNPNPPALYPNQVATTPPGRRKTDVSNLQPETFCKYRPQGIPGCLDPLALNYSPTHTEDCSGSIAHTYSTSYNISIGLNIPVDYSCCVLNVPGWECDETVDNDFDYLGDCTQSCTYGTVMTGWPWPLSPYTTAFEVDNCYSAETECLSNCPFNPTHLPGYSCNYPNTPHGCAQNCLYNIASPTAGCPHTSMWDCEAANGNFPWVNGGGSPDCGPKSGWWCKGSPGNSFSTPLSVVPWNPGSSTVPSAGAGGFQLNMGTNVSLGANMYRPGCQYTTNWWTNNPFTPVLYDIELDCLADCSPCAAGAQGGTGKDAQEWCDDIMDELVSQFGSQATEANLFSLQFKDPNPTNPPHPYSSVYDSSWWFKYRHCCQGRLSACFSFNNIQTNSISGLVPVGGTLQGGGNNASQTPKIGLGNRFPSPGNNINTPYTSPGFWCNFNASLNSNYTSSGTPPFSWVNGQGYLMNSTLSTTNGPTAACQGEQINACNFENPLIT